MSRVDDDSPVLNASPSDTNVFRLLAERRSVRAYQSREVSLDLLSRLLEVSGRAPSGSNVQPWQVHVVTGSAKTRLTTDIMEQRKNEVSEPEPDYRYYPENWPEPYLTRRRKLGWSLYSFLGIAKGDRLSARRWHDENFAFFGAPVGLIFTLDRRMGTGAFLDVGTYLQSIAIAARSCGLETCMQAAFASYHAIVRKSLSIAENRIVVCGMALGYENVGARRSLFRTERVPLSEYVVFHEE